MTILDSAVASDVAAAADQLAQWQALIAPWAGGDVTVKVLSGSTLLTELVCGTWVLDTEANPIEGRLGVRETRTHSANGTPTKAVFATATDDVFEFTAGVGSGDISFAAAIQAGAAEDLSSIVITALSTLPLPAAPSWTNITVGTWIAIPGTSTLQSIDPKNNPLVNPSYPGAAPWDAAGLGFLYAVTAWSSFSSDSSRGIAFQTAQGGHSNYYGNGVYKWSLNRETPLWSVIRNPSNLASYTIASGLNDYSYSDGTPRSNHGYNSCIYIPGYGPAQAGLEGVAEDGRLGTRAVVIWNESTGVASFGAAPSSSGSGTGIAACFDPSRGTAGTVWRRQHGTSVIQPYDVATNTWGSTASQSAQGYAGSVSLSYCPTHDVILVGEGDDQGSVHQTTAGGWLVFNPATQQYHPPTFTGAPSLGVAGTGGLWPGTCQPVWVDALGCFCAWDNTTSRTLITTITPPSTNPTTNAWTIGTLTVDGSNAVTPSAAVGEGTYGRFFYWEPAGGFVLLNAWDETGYFFKAHT